MSFPIHMDDLGALVTRLRVEGFDARSDLFNGQVGLIVGPNGLDPKRMPPDTAGLFFPLWELNYTANRSLVAAREFHEIFESRPPNWQFNRPYQRRLEHERLNLRHWNRSASLLGSRKLEEAIQQELIRRFPPSEFPVNIDVVGGQENSYAVVQVNNFDAGIDEKANAIPEDFLASGGMLAAALSAADHVMSELQKTGRIPVAPQRQSTAHISVPLTLQVVARSRSGSEYWTGPASQYEVDGMPSGEQAWIANFGSCHHESWRILRAENGVQSDWTGDYNSAEEALAVLQKELE